MKTLEEKVRDLQNPAENYSVSKMLGKIKLFSYHARGGWSFTNKDKLANLSMERMSSHKGLL